MARIPQETIDAMKQQVDLLALVRAKGVELKRHGRNWKGCCPFHDDHDPSLIVTPHKHLWNCLGCDAGGDAYQWVMKSENVSFRRAHEILSERWTVGGAAAKTTSGKPRKTTPLEMPVDLDAEGQPLLKQVVDYYHSRLAESEAAMEYLKNRGIDNADAIKRFKIGFADRTLGMRLPVRQVQAGAQIRGKLQEVGIIRSSGHEQFNGCVVFPIFDTEGNVCEIYGRKINDNLRKGTAYHMYLDGEQRLTESRGVWNMDGENAGEDIILCESIIDALTYWCSGYHNVTTSYGTNGFTDEHLTAFQRTNKRRVLLAYDRDDAGTEAAQSLATETLLPAGLDCYRVKYPAGMDANEYALKITPAVQSLGLALRQAEWMGKGAAPTDGPITAQDVAAAKEEKLSSEPSDETKAAQNGAANVAAKEESQPTEPTPAAANDANTETTASSLAASPVPAAPKEIEAEVTESEVKLQMGNRSYRIRGLGKNMSFEQLKVNIMVAKGELVHVDTFDLYNARARASFVKVAASELAVNPDVLKKDVGRILLKLEELQDQQIALARSPQASAPKLSDEEQAAALELLKDPKLLQRIVDDFDACGVVGEETNKLTGYLAAVSRKLDKPLAVVIQSSSSAGKTSLMDAVLKLIPAEEQIKYSAMTGQSLFYMGETNLKHKILAISEEEGVEQASYALKLLQSEGELRIASAGKNSDTGRLGTEDYHVEGPVMIFFTTTSSDVDFELVNRCLVLAVNEDRDQTRAIHERQRSGQTLEGMIAARESKRIVSVHQNAQRMLRPLAVVNPYAEQLTFLDDKTRMRRDHMKYLSLIRTIALLHQYQRPILRADCGGETMQYIEVTPHDIAVANGLAGEVLGRTLDELSPQARRLLLRVHEMVSEQCKQQSVDRADYRFTRRDIREAIGWTDYQVRTHLTKLVQLEYVLTHRGRRGQQFVYELLYDGQGREGQPFLMGLIDPAQIKGYDEKNEGSQSKFEHSQANNEAPLRVQRGSIEAPMSDSKKAKTNGKPSVKASSNGKPR